MTSGVPIRANHLDVHRRRGHWTRWKRETEQLSSLKGRGCVKADSRWCFRRGARLRRPTSTIPTTLPTGPATRAPSRHRHPSRRSPSMPLGARGTWTRRPESRPLRCPTSIRTGIPPATSSMIRRRLGCSPGGFPSSRTVYVNGAHPYLRELVRTEKAARKRSKSDEVRRANRPLGAVLTAC